MKSIFNQHRRRYKHRKSYSPSTEYVLGALQVTEHLLQNGEDAKARRYLRERFGNFLPFKYAVAYGYVKVVELLLNLGADPNVLGFLDQSSLHMVCKPRPKMSTRIELRRDVIQTLSSPYVDPIEAIVYDSRDLIKDRVDLQIIELLLKHKCKINPKNAFGQTPLFYTFMNYYDDPMFRLDQHSRDILYEISASELEKMEKIQKEKLDILLRYDVDMKITDVNKNTILMFAVYNLEAKRRPSRYSNMTFKDTVLTEMIFKLLKKGFDVNAKDIYNRTALQYAVALLSVDVVKILLEHGANVNDVKLNLDDSTCFYYHDLLPCLEAVENLLDLIDILLEKGWTFSLVDNLAVLKFLVMHGTRIHLDTTGNVDFDFSNKLFYGTPTCIDKILNDMTSSGARVYFYEKCHHYMKFMSANKFYVHPNIKTRLEQLDLQPNCIIGHDIQDNKLKKFHLYGNITLYDLLSMHPYKLYPYLKCGNYRRFTRSNDLQDEQNWYNIALKGHIAKALIRKYVLNSAKDYLRRIIPPNLPDLCYEEILQYFTNDEVFNLCLAAINDSAVKTNEYKSDKNVVNARSRKRCSIS